MGSLSGHQKLAIATVLTLSLIGLRVSTRILAGGSIALRNPQNDMPMGSVSNNAAQQPLLHQPSDEHKNASFPPFMMLHPADAQFHDPPNHNCNILDPNIPAAFNVSHYPRTYPVDALFKAAYGNLKKAWDHEGIALGAAPPRDGGASDQRIRTVACTFTEYLFIHHFPHQMQHLVPCWSLWRHFPDAEHVLLVHPQYYQIFSNSSSFSAGMIRVLEHTNISVIQKTIMNYRQSYTSDRKKLLIANTPRNKGFFAAHMGDMAHLRRSVLTTLGLEEEYQDASCGTMHVDEARRTLQNTTPRIVIVNRRKSRRLLHAPATSKILQHELRLPYRPPIVFFDEFTFEQQVEALNNVDILLSPHGAHLTGIPFMQRCGSVIEVIPHGYGIPHCFGTLAAVANVNHSYVYLGKDMIEETKQLGATKIGRANARRSLLCVPVEMIVQATRIQMENWKQCCKIGDA